jgi:TRAP-type C4-dicarboxylate transport system permease small subunit
MKKLYILVGKAETVISATCFALSCLMIFFAAIARSLKQPINWSQDLSLFLFSWSVFLSADVAMRADKLVNVDLLVKLLPPRARRWIAVFNHVAILAFLAALVLYGVKMSLFSWRRSFQGIPGFSYGWVALSIPFGCFLLGATVVLKIKGLLYRGKQAPGESGA